MSLGRRQEMLTEAAMSIISHTALVFIHKDGKPMTDKFVLMMNVAI
jgi:hypothetical protein